MPVVIYGQVSYVNELDRVELNLPPEDGEGYGNFGWVASCPNREVLRARFNTEIDAGRLMRNVRR